MKKHLILLSILLVGCSSNNVSSSSLISSSSSSTSSSSSSKIELKYSDYAYIHLFEDGNHYEYYTNKYDSRFTSLSEGNAEIGPHSPVVFKEYSKQEIIGGDTFSIASSGGMWSEAIYPAGWSCIEKVYDIKYYPSVIYEVTLIKEVIEGDQIQIGFNDPLLDSLENYYVISKDEQGEYIKKELSDYDDNVTLYYSFNQKMENPHKYSFLYDYKVR